MPWMFWEELIVLGWTNLAGCFVDEVKVVVIKSCNVIKI